MGTDPVRQRLGPGRFGVGVARRAEHRDEHLGLADLAGGGVDQLDGLPGIVDEQPLAGRMHLAHRRRQPALPPAAQLAEPRIAVAVGLARPVLLPQQHQGDARPAQLAMQRRPVRLGLAPGAGRDAGADEQQRLERGIAQRRRQRPDQAGRRRVPHVVAHRAARHHRAARDRPVAGAAAMLLAKDLSDTTHRRSLGWHRLPSWLRREPMRESARDPGGWPTSNRNRWPTSSRNQWPASNRNPWPACVGIST